MSIPRKTLAKYITEGCCFVETGTRWGDTTISAILLGAGCVFTCEIDRIFAAIAEQHIEDVLRSVALDVDVSNDSSPEFLSFNLDPTETAVVYLDAHTDSHSPILEELAAIKHSWAKKPETLLIDDVRLFKSKQWGISLEDVIAGVNALGDYEITYDLGIEPEDILVARKR